MNVLEAIYARRSVRAYAPRVVEEKDIHALLRAAVQAPSAMNAQPWLFAIVQDPAQLSRTSDRAKAKLLAEAAGDSKAMRYAPLLQSDSFNVFYDATTLIVIGAKEHGAYVEADCWIAAENLMLAATEMGLGSCPIGFAIGALNEPAAKEELHFPPAGVIVAPIIVGYPASAPPPVVRAEPTIASWTR